MSLSAQESNKVKWVVVDDAGRPTEYVHEVAIQLPDSAFVTGVVSDSKGSFRLEHVPAGALQRLSAIGYHTQLVSPCLAALCA